MRSPARLPGKPSETEMIALSEHNKTPDWDASRFPYYKRFARDYLSSGRLAMMSHLQRSIYGVLLDRAWVEDGLPQEPRRLAAMGLATPDEIDEAWTFPLDEAFTVGLDGRLRNPRMEVERVDAVRLRDARSRGGSKSPARVLQESSAPPRSDPEESPNKPQAQPQPQAQSESPTETEKPRKRVSGKQELASALTATEAPDWLAPLLEEYRQARVDMKAVPWREKKWTEAITFLVSRPRAFAEGRVSDAVASGWKRLRFPDDDANAQPRASQAPPAGRGGRGGWYKGPAPRFAEVAEIENAITCEMGQLVGNILLEKDAAQDMARERGHFDRLMLDWKIGLRDTAPEKVAQPITIDITVEPPY